MKLRDHPLMSYHGVHNWPPVWVSLYDNDDALRRTEFGVLTEVRESQFGGDRIVLLMEYNQNTYGAALTFADLAFYKQILELMKSCIGSTIKDIAEIDLTHTL